MSLNGGRSGVRTDQPRDAAGTRGLHFGCEPAADVILVDGVPSGHEEDRLVRVEHHGVAPHIAQADRRQPRHLDQPGFLSVGLKRALVCFLWCPVDWAS